MQPGCLSGLQSCEADAQQYLIHIISQPHLLEYPVPHSPGCQTTTSNNPYKPGQHAFGSTISMFSITALAVKKLEKAWLNTA